MKGVVGKVEGEYKMDKKLLKDPKKLLETMEKGRQHIKKGKEFEIRIWDYLNIHEVNEELDAVLEKAGLPFGIAVDIDYTCLSIDAKGNLKLKAEFMLDGYPTRTVELAVGQLDQTWYTTNVEIPKDTPDDKIEEVAVEQLTKELGKQEVAFITLYHIPPIETRR
jgi:hypothetical protein